MRRAWTRTLLIVALPVSVLAFVNWARLLSGTGLEHADQRASVLSLAVGVLSLVVSVISLVVTWRAAAPADATDVIHDHLVRRTRRSLEEEATARDLHPPYLQPTRWSGAGGSGTIEDLARHVADLPVRQLVVLGAPGSGKSSMALRLALDLLDGDTRVPVLLSVPAWDPERSLDDWLASTLLQVHPDLRDGRRFGRSAATVAAGRVLPVLDGFDEAHPAHRVAVLRRLRTELAAGRPLVLVSQEKPFREAVQRSGVTLARASEITVQPLRPDEAARYLPVGQHRGTERWRDVVDHIERTPRGRLAVLLSSPLMIYLARVAYDDPRTDPGELLTMTNPEARAALLDAFLPAVYGRRAGPYPAARAGRWLRYLARRMVARDRPVLHWWQLPDLNPATAGSLRLLVGVLGSVFMSIRFGLPVGLITAVVASRAVGAPVTGPRPVRTAFRPAHAAVGLVVGGAWAAAIGLLVVPDEDVLVPALSGLGIGLTTALLTGVAFGRVHDDRVDDGRALRDDRNVLLAVLAVAAITGLRSGLQWNWWMGTQQFGRTAVILLTALGIARVGVPWLRFAWARLLLALTGRTPFRLRHFLDDAHRRGILRRSGAGLEFRHTTLLRYLAAPPDPARAAPSAPR
ncbi:MULTISPECIES: NACHT domain-containing protein [Catenuloplanes]|uniref:NACHT domain-containing protein n=1 Tax=Catenuloplanes niger TaxID=587534 RepID=A0AAE4A2U7_9ACTN|nr:NACHT domain-containing protein [Catenuloplanes niger]MDR7328185.1 hypothetical protein [Catenuloplanes niger]